ncbi:hypothetical protein ACKF11_06425 [Methylobacillus sp. Pita2]|uniref:hypothetical protein n=1 Tax=Methylobacillus sp. Pita2 TaxID=3383245 RepID=UPI0038B5B078
MTTANFTAGDLIDRNFVLSKIGPLMKNQVLAKFNEEERMYGGEYGMALLKLIIGIAESQGSHTTLEQTFIDKDYIIQKSFEASGDISPKAAGVIATLVEYIMSEIQAGQPSMERWIPESKLSNDDIQKERIEIAVSWIKDDLGIE